MTAEPQWDSTRWRDAVHAPNHDGLQQHPRRSASHTQSPLSASRASATQSWHDRAYEHPYHSPRSSQSHTGQAPQHLQPERRRQNDLSDARTAPWCFDQAGYIVHRGTATAGSDDDRDGRADAQLSLHIPPKPPERSSTSHGYRTPRSDPQICDGSTGSWSHPTTSLPSFAALSEQAARTGELDDVQIAPMSARINHTSTAGHDQRRPSASMPYSNTLKRSADQWDQDDMLSLKLPRIDGFSSAAAAGNRRTSVDFASRDPVQRSTYSPAPSDSAPGSACPRQTSPVPGRLPRALPSPTSLAFPPSGAASAPPGAASIGSPGTSYIPASSVHTVSTSSATSAHLQDLQHQVSLKSLALQTLQTEYATLLQKLQRERIKSQTIEKKTNVADQEVNDLTTKNDELCEQVRALEAQLQDYERKRETERLEASKEKEQWSRMLDMSGRLQNRQAEERQRLANEKASLLKRLAVCERDGSPQTDRPSIDPDTRLEPLRHPSASLDAAAAGSGSRSANGPALATTSEGLTGVEDLKRENSALHAQLANLRSALEEVRRQGYSIEENVRHISRQGDLLRKIVDQTLVDGTPTKTATQDRDAGKGQSVPCEPDVTGAHAGPTPQPTDDVAAESTTDARTAASNAATSTQTQTISSNDPLSPQNLARSARAVSPGPAELGFHVQPSTSSPEELIKALGPVPAPLSSLHFSSSPSDDFASPGRSDHPRRKRRQSQPSSAPLSPPRVLDASTRHTHHSFRPLHHHQHHDIDAVYPRFHDPDAAHYARTTGTSPPHSYQSPPGPNANSSSSSPPDSRRHTASPEHIAGARGYSLPHPPHLPPFAAWSPSTAAMPPPPRPLP